MNTRLLRYGLASIIVGGGGMAAILAACSDDSSSSGGTPDTGAPDSSPYDSSVDAADAADAAKPTLAKLTIVNATTDLGPSTVLDGRLDQSIRVCFKQGTTEANLGVAPYPPLPDKGSACAPGAPPGIPSGAGGVFPSFGLDLSNRIIVPIVMNAKKLFLKGIVNPGTGSPGTTCDELVGATKNDAGSDMVDGVDYWTLPEIPAGTFQVEKSYVIVLSGCVGNPVNPNVQANHTKCGANANLVTGTAGNGNLSVKVLETQRTPVSASQVGAQFLYASTQANAVFGAVSFPINPGFESNPLDASTFKAATSAPATVLTVSPPLGVTGVAGTDYFVMSKDSPATAGKPTGPMQLDSIQKLSGECAATSSVYVNGKNFVFIPVGDPLEASFKGTDGGCANAVAPPNPGACGDGGDGTSFDPKSFHYLAFPTDPAIVPYTP